MSKKRIVVICLGCGIYMWEIIKYLRDCNRDFASMIKWMDKERKSKNKSSITNLESMQFKSKI
jgi:hypothetical protein